jgi:hypothetical protein
MVLRRREKVALAEAEAYQAELLADFERKIAAIYKPSDHPVWQKAHADAANAVAVAREKIEATFKDLGIPEDWAPDLSLGWHGRGENAARERRAELRRVAQSEAEKRCLVAQAEIKRRTVEMETRIVAASLSSAAAQTLLTEMPTPAQLMPELDLQAIEDINPPATTWQKRRALLYSSDND